MANLTTYIAFLRAINVGGTGKLPMVDLRDMCESVGFKASRTYLASGNLIFESEQSETEVKATLEGKLSAYAGKPMSVLVRTACELIDILAQNPFPEAPPNRSMVIFLDNPPPTNVLDNITGKNDEELRIGRREIYVHYHNGIGDSKLRIPSTKEGTMRNMNTIAKLVFMTRKPD
jgi:uncharacterized protein (DUF1697 family)